MIKLAVFDFDGVFSDKIYVTDNGEITKSYNPKDSYSLKLLKDKGIKIGIITGCSTNAIDHMEKIVSRVDFISKNDYKKIDTINKWVSELNINLNNVSYIGDDVFDAQFMDLIGFTACPADAVRECKDKANYICKNKGGDGAVREFVEEIIKRNDYSSRLISAEHIKSKKEGKITAVIPVRSGSTRCNNKNIRAFGDTTLLEKKILLLKQIPEIDKIIVSSNDDQMLDIAIKHNISIEKRDPYYARTETSGSELFEYLASKIDTPNMMYVHAVCPFVSIDSIKNIIKIYKDNDQIDCVMSSTKLQHFLWKNNKPVNYNPYDACPSQFLEPYNIPVFTAIISTEFVKHNKSVIGYCPYFYNLTQIEAIDIDTPFEFLISELLYKNKFEDNDDIVKYLNRVDNIKTELLDCTIRDGGYINNWQFSDDEVLDCYKAVTEAGYDYFELGFLDNDQSKGKYYNLNEEIINNIYQKYQGCKLCFMINIEKLHKINKKINNISLVRILFNYFKTSHPIDHYVAELQRIIDLGYEVCINFAYSDKFLYDDIDKVISPISGLKLKCIYLADTFGYLDEESTRTQLYNFQKILYNNNSNIPLAFHAHNNMNNALAKSKTALDFKIKMLDSTIYGLGRGAGNLNSELIMMELNKRNKNEKYDLLPILKFGDKYIRKYSDKYVDSKFVYSNTVLYSLAGYLSLHPDYIKYICEKYPSCDMEKIYYCLTSINNHLKKTNDNSFYESLVDNYFL